MLKMQNQTLKGAIVCGSILLTLLSLASFHSLIAVYKPIKADTSDLDRIYVPLILHYDSYFYRQPREALEEVFEFLKSISFPMDKVSILVWRDVLENNAMFYDLKNRLERYGFYWDQYHVGLFLPPKDANDKYIVALAMEDYKNMFGRYPYFVAGFAASNDTYMWLEGYGVKITFFNLWEDGQDYSFRGRGCPDKLKGANWEGSPFQPYKPSIRSSNVPGLHAGDEIDIWECLWVFRNPSYAYLEANYAGWGSIHPGDLLLSSSRSLRIISVEKALSKLRNILDLVELNAKYNKLIVLSYITELQGLQRFPDRIEVWKKSILEFKKRGYIFVNPRDLRILLDSSYRNMPQTPTYFWVDNLTHSDVVMAGRELPFAMVLSPYGRFIFCRKDIEKDPFTPHLSLVSYLSARAHNRTFQSIREAIGGELMKLNVIVNGTPIFMRWKGDIARIDVFNGSVMIEFNYTKKEIPFLDFVSRIYLTPYGIYVSDLIKFKSKVYVDVNFLQYVTMGNNSPAPPSDDGLLVMDDYFNKYVFSGNNEEVIGTIFEGDLLLFKAKDGYSFGLRVLNRPERTVVYDEIGDCRWETVSYYYEHKTYFPGDELSFSYLVVPAESIGQVLLMSDKVLKFLGRSVEIPSPIGEA